MRPQPSSQHHHAWAEEFLELQHGRTRMLVLEPRQEEWRAAGWRVSVATLLHSHGMMVPIDIENASKGIPELLLGAVQPSESSLQALGAGRREGEVRLWRLVRYDLRGEGESEAGSDYHHHTCEGMAEDLEEIVRELIRRHYPHSLLPTEEQGRCSSGEDGRGIDSAACCIVLSGLSMGVGATLHAVVRRQLRASALLLLMPPPAYGHNPLSAKSFKRLADMVERKGKEFAVSVLLTVLFEGKEEADVQHSSVGFCTRAMAPYLRDWDAKSLHQSLLGGSVSRLPAKEAVAEALACHPVPVLLLPLLGDRNHPIEVAEELAAVLPHVSHRYESLAPRLLPCSSTAAFGEPKALAAVRELMAAAARAEGMLDDAELHGSNGGTLYGAPVACGLL